MNNNFYKKFFKISIPMVIEQILLTSFGIIDTMMVKYIPRGVGGVGNAAQIGSMLGIVSFAFAIGVGMFIAQYFGDKDKENLKKSVSLLLFLMFVTGTIFMVVGLVFCEPILSIFSDDPEVISVGVKYVKIGAFAYVPNVLAYAFTVSYRNVQKPLVPLTIQIISALINILFNWLLIFGIGPFPQLGIEGAAYGTVISCCFSLVAYIVYGILTKQEIMPNVNSFCKCFDKTFISRVMKKSLPLMINESCFAVGTMVYIKIYNLYGPDDYEGFRISDTVSGLWMSAAYAFSMAITAMIGEQLGASNFENSKNYGDRFIKNGVLISVSIGVLMAITAIPSVMLFQGGEISKRSIYIARLMTFASAIKIALRFYGNVLFSIFRAGGKSKFVMLLDCGIMWAVGIPIGIIAYFTIGKSSIVIVFLCIQLEYIARIFIGLREYKKYKWINNIIK